ncbi:MAG: hypothetical protein ACE14L_10940 [Terriglobales bacterium]
MKNIYDVLRQKEAEFQQLQKEIEALRIAARLLADDNDARAASAAPAASARGISAVPAKDAAPAWEAGPRQFP